MSQRVPLSVRLKQLRELPVPVLAGCGVALLLVLVLAHHALRFGITLNGERATVWRGTSIEKLLDKGCILGFNLDGGDTSCIVFMGHQLCKMQNGKRNKPSRATSDILGVGTSSLLPTVNDPW